MSQPTTEHELEVEHLDAVYIVAVEVAWEYVDDSFDHDWGGRRQTEHLHHWEAGEWEVLSCCRIHPDPAEDVEPDDIKGLVEAIGSQITDIEAPADLD